MANPVVVSCPIKTWTKVVDNKTVGWIYLQSTFFDADTAYFTFVDTGETGPSIDPGATGHAAVPMESQSLPFNSSDAIDIYLWPNQEDITVLVSAI